jgi:hypothetical protein
VSPARSKQPADCAAVLVALAGDQRWDPVAQHAVHMAYLMALAICEDKAQVRARVCVWVCR